MEMTLHSVRDSTSSQRNSYRRRSQRPSHLVEVYPDADMRAVEAAGGEFVARAVVDYIRAAILEVIRALKR